MKDLTQTELAWIAGLLEGEGCFSLKKMASKNSVYPGMEVRCNMTDKDVVYRLYELCGGHFRGPIQKAKLTVDGNLPKVQWLWTLGRRAGCEDLMRQLLPYMGERRSAKIREILAAGEEHPARGWHHGRWAWEAKLCECDECREAFNKHHRDYRAKRKARDIADGSYTPKTWQHGRAAWDRRQCRCEVCHEASREHVRRQSARRRELREACGE